MPRPTPVTGTIASWDPASARGTLKSESSASKDKEFWFDHSNIGILRFSGGSYTPKVGDYVMANVAEGDEGRVDSVMESLR